MVSDCSPDRALTERILEVADEAGYRAALIDATDGSVTAWPRFARTVRAAAAGLARRGLAEGDTAGVFVQDAASAAIAVNAIRAAGGRACLIRSDAGPADIADRLNACAARVLITSAPLAGLAAEGADRSRVRQVIAFGDADGTTPFSSLLGSGRHSQPDAQAAAEPGFAERSGPAHESGRPEGNGQTHERDLTDSGEPGSGGDLTHRDVVVAAPPCGDGPAYTSLLDLTLLAGATLVAAPVPLVAPALRVYKGTAAIVPPGTGVPGLEPARIFAAG
jgi:acyl-CoA synthetase (AMP-forming)/AMP-acid ligase II